MKYTPTPTELLEACLEARRRATDGIRHLRTSGVPISTIAARCGVSTIIIRAIVCEPMQLVHTGEMAARILAKLEASKGEEVKPEPEPADCKPKISDVQIRLSGNSGLPQKEENSHGNTN